MTMRRVILLGVAVGLALAVPATANAYHSNGEHWPGPGTVAQNGGGCAQPCVWLKFIDRTGLGAGTAWRNTIRARVVNRLRTALPGSFQVTWQNGSRFNLWTASSGLRFEEAFAQTPVAAVFIGWNASEEADRRCEFFPEPWIYCRDDGLHLTKAVVGVSGSGAGLENTATHELGHALGLGHRILDENYNCDGPSVMCGFEEYMGFDAHDRAELALPGMYGGGH